MCHALLTTCHLCTWLLSIAYPLCSHAKAYALDPSACPHRMRRRYKASGMCSACKANVDTKSKQNARNESLSVTPCEVRIEFRDTEIGAVEEGDKVRGVEGGEDGKGPGERGRGRRESNDENASRSMSASGSTTTKPDRKTRCRARKGKPHSHLASTYSFSEDDDNDNAEDDVYIAPSSPSASISSSASSSLELPLPRKHKAGARPRTLLHKPRAQPRKRKRSPGVLERVQMAAVAKKGRRGRPPRQKMVWPNRIDAVEFEEVEREKKAKEGKKRGGERPGVSVRAGKVERRALVEGEGERVEYGRCDNVDKEVQGEEERGGIGKTGGLGSRGLPLPLCSGSTDGVDDLARIIALEASRREKKWR